MGLQQILGLFASKTCAFTNGLHKGFQIRKIMHCPLKNKIQDSHNANGLIKHLQCDLLSLKVTLGITACTNYIYMPN